nr:hypothetical protein [Clostridia bacterium]
MLFFITISIILVNVIMLIFSSFKLIVTNLEINNSNNKIMPIYELKIAFYLLGKIKLFSFKINNNKTKKILEKDFIKQKIENIKIKSHEKSKKQKKFQIKILKQFIKKLELESINLLIYVDTKNVILTSYFVAIISSIIPNILKENIKNFDSKHHIFKITPLYKNQNYIYIKLNCIINIKIVHIISMYKLGNKYKGGKKYERSPYRRFNVNCYGKY